MMISQLKKRHSRWYERLLLNVFIQIILMSLICVLLPAYILWGWKGVSNPTNFQYISLWLNISAVVFIIISFRMMMRLPGTKSSSILFSTVLASYLIVTLIFSLLREIYSIKLLLVSFSVSILFIFVGYFLSTRWIIPKIAYLNLGKVPNVESLGSRVRWIELKEPDLRGVRIDALAVDLHCPDLNDDWQRFIANCALNHIPVYNFRQLEESLTGRVRIRHMYENDLGALLPSSFYMQIKYLCDCCLIILTLPFSLPLTLIAVLMIKFDDGGKVFYKQKRVGYRGKIIEIYKFRTMTERAEEVCTSTDDIRITKAGHFLRKTRIDEIPQFISVLKGEMSLIGPRAEFVNFAVELEKEVPFFNYRHIVKPGISGWAQVNQGYATGVDETKVKIQYDFYYIKNYSFWLDLLIIFKTIKTMLTGFGAR